MIKREKYLSEIRPFIDVDLIKVIIGIRRCGKSILLDQIMEELDVDKDNIIKMSFEDLTYSNIKNANDLHNYITEKIVNSNKYYLFFDEIQNVLEWEKAINSFKATMNVSIFITGSNSKLLSGELATYLAGRYVSFRLQPFTFNECLEYFRESMSEVDIFNNYVKYGSMPQSLTFTSEHEKYIYLSDLFDSIILKDIISRYNIKDIELFKRLLEYFMSNPSQVFSPKNLSSFLESVDRKVSKETIYNYLDYMCDALILNKVHGYDIRGKKILTRNHKYYLTDLGFGYLYNRDKKLQTGSYLENIVYNELISSNYKVSIGKVLDSEIDFIAEKNGNRIYIQVTYLLASESTIKREFAPFYKLEDNHPKYLVSMDPITLDRDGIKHMNIIEFLKQLDQKQL